MTAPIYIAQVAMQLNGDAGRCGDFMRCFRMPAAFYILVRKLCPRLLDLGLHGGAAIAVGGGSY